MYQVRGHGRWFVVSSRCEQFVHFSFMFISNCCIEGVESGAFSEAITSKHCNPGVGSVPFSLNIYEQTVFQQLWTVLYSCC